jgi:hypothetical protein
MSRGQRIPRVEPDSTRDGVSLRNGLSPLVVSLYVHTLSTHA